MKSSRLKLYLLGSIRFKLDEQSCEIRLHKAVALLAYLAVTGQSHRRDSLATLFWPDHSQEKARNYLRNALWVLKESLGERWFIVGRDEIGLQSRSRIWVDAAAFRQNLKAVENHQILHMPDDPCQACIDNLTKAVDLYRDDFLSGFTLPDSPAFDDWQDFQCEDLRLGFGSALERLALWQARQGNDTASIALARRLVLVDPFNENGRRLLMEGLYRSGHRADALQQYQNYAQTMERELGVLPSPELAELYQVITAGAVVTDKQVLKTRKREEIGQPPQPDILPGSSRGVSVGTPSMFVPPITFPGQIPFVERQCELGQLDELLRAAVTGRGKIAVILGEPGSGKTTLALEFARRAQKMYPDLIVAGGTSQGQWGLNEPYWVFREVINLLAGEVEQRWAGGMLTPENLNRLFAFLPTVLQTLIDHSPDLITTFLPTLNLSSKVWAYKDQDVNATSLMLELFLQTLRVGKKGALNQSLILEQYEKTLRVLSAHRPLLLILDDLHWADPSSTRLLSYSCKRVGQSRILIIGIYAPWELEVEGQEEGRPFGRFLSECGLRDDSHWIDLDQAGRLDGQQYVKAILALEASHMGERFEQTLHRVTGGQPLFLAECLQTMKESGDLYRDAEGYWTAAESLFETGAQPESLEAVIQGRIARLPPQIRRALDAASVEGFEFTAESVAGVLKTDGMEIIQLLSREPDDGRMVLPLSLYQSGPRRLSWFRFRHSLFQEVLYSQLDNAQRTYLHGATGASLEQLYGDQAEQIANQLAWHFQEAGNNEKAADYFQKAGRRASCLGANQEAAWLYRRGLDLVDSLPENLENKRREAELLSALAAVGHPAE